LVKYAEEAEMRGRLYALYCEHYCVH